KQGAASAIPALPKAAHTAVYIEMATTAAELEQTAEAVGALLEACGSSADTAWTATTEEETEGLKAFRHALPETINQRIGERAQKFPGLTKLGTDLAVPDEALLKMMAAYRDRLSAAGLEYVMFGHIGDNHVHVNILPRNLDEYAQGKALYLELAQQALAWGGTVSGEHGIGKLKKPFLSLMYGAEGIAAMRAVKRVFDPAGLLNPGTLFDVEGSIPGRPKAGNNRLWTA
ncbi:MAG: FAD-binding oxidoreductase, partial [Lentisphaerae bacterium]|nr:FAD-binding oxidoreductase [Lentisphaerota bacterium]